MLISHHLRQTIISEPHHNGLRGAVVIHSWIAVWVVRAGLSDSLQEARGRDWQETLWGFSLLSLWRTALTGLCLKLLEPRGRTRSSPRDISADSTSPSCILELDHIAGTRIGRSATARRIRVQITCQQCSVYETRDSRLRRYGSEVWTVLMFEWCNVLYCFCTERSETKIQLLIRLVGQSESVSHENSVGSFFNRNSPKKAIL